MFSAYGGSGTAPRRQPVHCPTLGRKRRAGRLWAPAPGSQTDVVQAKRDYKHESGAAAAPPTTAQPGSTAKRRPQNAKRDPLDGGSLFEFGCGGSQRPPS